MRKSTVETVLARRYGVRLDPSRVPMFKKGMAGGYHYKKLTPQPEKNGYSHPVEAFENMLMGGGEGMAATRGNVVKLRPSPIVKRHPSFR